MKQCAKRKQQLNKGLLPNCVFMAPPLHPRQISHAVLHFVKLSIIQKKVLRISLPQHSAQATWKFGSAFRQLKSFPVRLPARSGSL